MHCRRAVELHCRLPLLLLRHLCRSRENRFTVHRCEPCRSKKRIAVLDFVCVLLQLERCCSARSTVAIKSLINVPVYISCLKFGFLPRNPTTPRRLMRIFCSNSVRFLNLYARHGRYSYAGTPAGFPEPKLFPPLATSRCVPADCDRCSSSVAVTGFLVSTRKYLTFSPPRGRHPSRCGLPASEN